MKRLLLVLILFSSNSLAGSWGPDLIKFSLESGPSSETMIWISGFSYSATAFYQRCGGLERTKSIGSKYLIEILNKRYAGKTITAEQATSVLDEALNKEYQCGAL